MIDFWYGLVIIIEAGANLQKAFLSFLEPRSGGISVEAGV